MTTNTDLLNAMKQNGNLIVTHVGNTEPKPTRYSGDAIGSPQTVINLKRKSGQETTCTVVIGRDGDTFRVVLDDKHRKIRKGETLAKAVRRYYSALVKRLWPDDEQYHIA